ncbi:hypothetical protein BC629DRAFT_882207 [Irpex lacteus]|nr:hypothetical protein BC629DRAFT_882207 [Irpex lacteus]
MTSRIEEHREVNGRMPGIRRRARRIDSRSRTSWLGRYGSVVLNLVVATAPLLHPINVSYSNTIQRRTLPDGAPEVSYYLNDAYLNKTILVVHSHLSIEGGNSFHRSRRWRY